MTDIESAIAQKAAEHKIDKALLMALVEQESDGNPRAMRFEPDYRWTYFPEKYAQILKIPFETELQNQKTSWGLVQVMGAVARENGFDAPLEGLCDPLTGLEYGCLLLKQLFSRAGYTQSDVIAAYNSGGRSKTSGGMYRNQSYVDSVDRLYRKYLI